MNFDNYVPTQTHAAVMINTQKLTRAHTGAIEFKDFIAGNYHETCTIRMCTELKVNYYINLVHRRQIMIRKINANVWLSEL